MIINRTGTPRQKYRFIRILTRFGIIGILISIAAVIPQPLNATQLSHEKMGSLPVPFIANQGQTDPRVAYYAPTFAGSVFITHQGELIYSLPGRRDAITTATGWTLVETLVDGQAQPTAGQPATTRVSYFIGDDSKRWRSALSTYASISLGEVWPGIDLKLSARANSVEKIFTVRPGANVKDIHMQLEGAFALTPANDGSLNATTAYGDVSFSAPVAWQQIDAQRRPIEIAYAVNDRGYGFNLGPHDPGLPVMIDPLLQATYLGGSDSDTAWDMDFHINSNDILVVGDTQSIDFPGTTGGAQETPGAGTPNAFVARLSAGLALLHQVTYLGGSGAEFGTSLALHPTSSQVYVTGLTSSTDFPATSGGAQPISNGSQNAFVARLSNNLQMLGQSTYLGGDDTDQPWAMGIHPVSGDVYIFGETRSDNFPSTLGGAQPAKDDFRDTFIARLSEDLKNLLQSTYLGAGGNDSGLGITLHPTSGEVYVTGYIGYALNDLPGVTGGAQETRASNDDEAFVSRLSADLKTLHQSTYLGGTRNEVAYSIAINPTGGNVYITGHTRSDDFPGTTGGAQEIYGGGLSGFEDAFVASFNSELTTLNQSTYLGGNNSDVSRGVEVHPASGEIYVAGTTLSQNFPGTAGAAQPAPAGLRDAFVARLSADLTTLNQATYLGGSATDFTFGLALHPVSGDTYVIGETVSASDFPSVSGGAQSAYSGGAHDAFIARLDASLSGADTVPDAFSFNDLSDVALNTLITSNAITVSGIDSSTSISISEGEYSIDGGAYTSAAGSIINGQAVTVQVSSSSSYNSTTDATLTIGGVFDTFSVTTLINTPPSAPELVAPQDGATGIDAASVNFEWKPATDPDGDTLSYDLVYCEDIGFSGCSPVDVTWYQQPGILLAGLGGGFGLLLLGVLTPSSRRAQRVIPAAMVIALALLFNACGGGGAPTTSNLSHSVTNLNASATYYWKIAADDGHGGISESAVWSFTTQ